MKRVVAIGLVATALALFAGVARAQEGIDVRSTSARSAFPDGIAFSILASASSGFDEVRLQYRIAPDGVRATAVPNCTGETPVTCTYQLGGGAQNPLIPGAEITYSWRLVSGGVEQETAQQTVTYEDDRFDWKTLTDGNLTLWWYAGSEDEARAVLTAARGSLDRISALLHTSVDFPVKLFYYGSADEMSEAIVPTGAEGVVTLGEVVYSDTAMVSADAAPEEIARHEVAHIVERQAVQGFSRIPDWLNEGTAVFAQTQPLSSQRGALERAIESNSVFSVRSISSASAGGTSGRVELFYAQSWSLVDFLVRTYGEEQFAQLFQAFDAGASTADALQQVYGFNQDGLENAWRASVGLPPRTAPTPDGSQNAAPTQVPRGSSGTAQDSGGGSNVAVITVVIALTVVFAGGLVGFGVYLARRIG